MEAKKKIRVECLDVEKAWQLFEKKVGEEALDSNPEIRGLAKIVANECCGLPLALIVVGRTMASKKKSQEWRHAITVLQKSTSEFSGMGDEVFPLLKFSYDNLHENSSKLCFLYCSLYPEDFNIESDQLIKHWIGEGFFEGFESMDEAYNKGCAVIGNLKAVSLLESGANRDLHVKMHDVIRDLAIWIGCECGERKDKFLVRAGAHLLEAPLTEKWKEAERISLMENYIKSLKDPPTTCTNMLTLLLQKNKRLRDISDNFFQFLPTLKVLNLSSTRIRHLPRSLTHLVELQFLDLSFSNIEELPLELKNLMKLKYLDLSYTLSLTIIPQGLILSLSDLRMLNLHVSRYKNWNIEELHGNVQASSTGVSLIELEHLKYLLALRLTLSSTMVLQKLLADKKLQVCIRNLKIKSCIGLVSLKVSWSSSFATTSLASTSAMPNSFDLGGMKNLQSLDIDNCISLEELTINYAAAKELFSSLGTLKLRHLTMLTIKWERGFTPQCYPKLQHVYINGCHSLEDLTWFIYLPNLKGLVVRHCRALKTIINNGVAVTIAEMNSLSNLKTLQLSKLPMLESIYEHALPFPSLEVIEVYDCPLLLKQPLYHDSAKNTLYSIWGRGIWWNNLQWEDESVKSSFQPYFRG